MTVLNIVSGLILCSLMYATGVQSLEKIMVDGENHWFVDESGRVRLFHGVNAVYKGFPWYMPYLVEDDQRMDDLHEFGLNIVRLGTMWSGVEPHEGYINDTYLDILQDIIMRLADRGIYSMLDMHQDVMTSLYMSYDGIPLWLVKKYPEPTNPYPWPLQEVNQWEEGYLTQAVSEAFQHFYDNYEASIERWANFWEVIAERFKDLPGLIGYNLINEPWIGDFFTNASLILPGVAGRVNLQPAYDFINDKIRQHDKVGIIFYEPVFYGQLLPGDLLGSGFDHVPGGPEYINASAFSYHTYCWNLEFIDANATDSEREEARQYCEDTLLPRKFQTQAENNNRTGGAAILTEFGLCKTHGDYVDIECEVYMRLADKYLQSWIDWDHNDWKWYDNDGNRIMDKISAYLRTYARATAGIPLNMTFDPESLHFHFEFTPDVSIEAPTEIYVPSYHYTNGFRVEVSEGLDWTADGPLVYVTVADSIKLHITANVTIDPI